MTVSSFFGREDYYTEAYEDNGVPVYDSPEKAARAMATLVRYKKIEDRPPYVPFSIPEPDEKACGILTDARRSSRKSLDEFSAKKLLACYGIPVPEEEVARHPDDAAAAAEQMGFPVAVKACDPDILHKSEQQLVHLNIANPEDVARAYQDIQNAAGRPVPVLIGRMMPGKREFLAGITHDPQFGHCVAFGLGGIFTEAVNDIAYRVAPLSKRDAEEMIADIRASKLFESFRGMEAVDVDALAELLIRLSFIPLIHPEIREIDMNPLIISGGQPVAVDALIVLE
jgi:acyl-CoA synthetase (NDP forming)